MQFLNNLYTYRDKHNFARTTRILDYIKGVDDVLVLKRNGTNS